MVPWPSWPGSSNATTDRLVDRSVREIFPGSQVAPGLVLAGIDSRHFEGIADQVCRVTPLRVTAQNLPARTVPASASPSRSWPQPSR